jgi:hypothetical protein
MKQCDYILNHRDDFYAISTKTYDYHSRGPDKGGVK